MSTFAGLGMGIILVAGLAAFGDIIGIIDEDTGIYRSELVLH